MNETVTMATLIAAVGDVFEAAIGWVGQVASTIAGQPILLVGQKDSIDSRDIICQNLLAEIGSCVNKQV